MASKTKQKPIVKKAVESNEQEPEAAEIDENGEVQIKTKKTRMSQKRLMAELARHEWTLEQIETRIAMIIDGRTKIPQARQFIVVQCLQILHAAKVKRMQLQQKMAEDKASTLEVIKVQVIPANSQTDRVDEIEKNLLGKSTETIPDA